MAIEAPQEHQFKELDKFSMFTDAPGVQGRRSRLVWSSFRGNPRISVFTGVPDDSNKGVLNAPMNPETFLILMSLLEDAIKGTPDRKFKVVNNTRPKAEEGQERSQEIIHLSDTWVGKDKEGVIWISVRAPNRPTIVFKFLVSEFHALQKGNGDPFTEAEASELQARAAVNGLRSVFLTHFQELKPPYDPEAAKARGGFNKGGYGNRQQQKPAARANSDAFEDLSI